MKDRFVDFMENEVIPILIILICMALITLYVVYTATAQEVNKEYCYIKTQYVYKGCTLYALWKEYGGGIPWDIYATEVKNLNGGRDMGDLYEGEEILIYVFE